MELRMKSAFLQAFTLLACAICHTPASWGQGTTSPLTLHQAIDLARLRNPSLLSGRQHLSATRANEITAGLRLNPNLTLSGTDVTLPANNPGNPYSYAANVSRLFERGEKRRWRIEGAQANTLVTASQYQDAEHQAILAVKQAFTQMLAAKAAVKVADENLAGYRRTVELSHHRLDAGDISGTDFERIDLQLVEFESDDDAAQLSLTQSSDQLQVLLGAEKTDPAFDITGTLDPPSLSLNLSDLEQRAVSERPDYIAAQQTVHAAEANAKLAIANGTADPTLGAEYDRSGNDNSAGFQVNFPLRIFDRNQGEKERTRYEVESSRLAAQAARNQVVSDVDQAWSAYLAATKQAQRYNTRYLAEATRVRDNLEFSYRQGGTTLLDYLDALRDFRQISLDTVNANAKVWSSIHQLSFVTASEVAP
jgi:cobalt-zinc-cadmium efflux system outer membrane protein